MKKEYPFELVENTEKQVILKNVAKDALSVAKFPFVSGDYEYITITKGENHTLTVIQEDASSFHFNWGSSTTVIDDNMKRLRREAVEFVERECAIVLGAECMDEPKEAHIYYNTNYKSWQGTLYYQNGQHVPVWDKESRNAEDMARYLQRFNEKFDVSCLEFGRAETGIDIWYLRERERERDDHVRAYKIEIVETFRKEVVVYAQDKDEAEIMVEDMIEDGKIELDYDNFATREEKCKGFARDTDLELLEVYEGCKGIDEQIEDAEKLRDEQEEQEEKNRNEMER